MSTPCPRRAARMNQKEFMAVKVWSSSSWLTWAWVPMDLTGFPVQVKIASYRGSGLERIKISKYFHQMSNVGFRYYDSFHVVSSCLNVAESEI